MCPTDLTQTEAVLGSTMARMTATVPPSLLTPNTVPLDFTAMLSDRARKMTASAIREILKITQQPDVISFAGGLPAPNCFPLPMCVRRWTP